MPDIYGTYSLTELARELKVVPTFINRIQRETGIGGEPDKKNRGKSIAFRKELVDTFRMVKALRLMDFTFKDIKELWRLEEEILKEGARITKKEPLKLNIEDLAPLPLHCMFSYFIETEEGEEVEPILKTYHELQNKLVEIKKEIASRWQAYRHEIDLLDGKIKGYIAIH